ncbi:hypothetical protein [Dietzia sp. ANT_WB102]|uniref:hypothetical protein n=1 Tax=Dietzia sp. ANT_WB102 TaxID=2597345 RepID=UPI00165EA2F5|nr:hypothetical protein [Dietzia sp. ANT_WB102]
MTIADDASRRLLVNLAARAATAAEDGVDAGDGNTFLHNGGVDGNPESTGDAREAADSLRRRCRVRGVTRTTRDHIDPPD